MMGMGYGNVYEGNALQKEWATKGMAYEGYGLVRRVWATKGIGYEGYDQWREWATKVFGYEWKELRIKCM
jgi:hypothetical protein